MTTVVTASSAEVEMTVLGCMMNSQDSFLAAHEIIETDDFADSRHRIIFKAIKEAHKSKGAIDIVIIGEILKNSGELQQVGSYGYLATLSQFAGTSAHIEAYCDDLRQLTIKRTLLNVHRSLAEDIEKGIDPHTILERLGTKVEDIKANKPKADSVFRHLLDAASESEIVKEIRNTSPGVRVGFQLGEIDLKIPGGAMTIVAGPTGHGKTMVLINFILNYLELHPNKQAFFFSYEESRSAILSLFLNTYINQDISKNNRESIKSYFRDGNVQFTAQDNRALFLTKKEKFFKELIETKRLNIFYSDYSAEELVQAIRFLKKNVDIGLVGIDYMQLLSLLNKKTIQRQEELKQICLMLKDCAVDTGLPVLLAAQFNRTVAAEADLSPTAIGEAGDIERAANMVIGLWNRNYEGFNREGNKGKDGKIIPKSPSMYLEILKGRETGIGHSSVFNLNGNTGKLTPKTGFTPTQINSHGEEIIADKRTLLG
jgi:replicative DNA helicase